jgi:hypothetical protein
MTIDTSREAIDRMTGMWGVGVEPNMARVTEMLAALTRERDEALADIARIQEERAEFVAGVEALAGVLKGERVEALAREAALHALILEGDAAADALLKGEAAVVPWPVTVEMVRASNPVDDAQDLLAHFTLHEGIAAGRLDKENDNA